MRTNMEAPDKIYIDDLAVVNDCVTKISLKRLPNFSEYIRKDALLEWAEETKAEIENQNVIKDDIRKGAVWELEEIINKLNKM